MREKEVTGLALPIGLMYYPGYTGLTPCPRTALLLQELSLLDRLSSIFARYRAAW